MISKERKRNPISSPPAKLLGGEKKRQNFIWKVNHCYKKKDRGGNFLFQNLRCSGQSLRRKKKGKKRSSNKRKPENQRH